jgi:DUF4097 and DUF4098 domain-containing protein YvlB
MRLNRLFALCLLGAAALPAAGQTRQTDDSFKWNGRIPAGRWLAIKNMNGDVSVSAASGDQVEVVATKHWRRGDPKDVRIVTETSGSDVTICALWGDEDSCDDRRHRVGDRNRHNDVSVDFRVLLPKGVKIDAGTLNGSVNVEGATDEVRAATVNGEVEAETSGGPANASDVNGSVRVKLGRADADHNMEFTTVNGDVVVEFTTDIGADVSFETVNGSLNTNFEMAVSGRLDPKHIRAHIGKPGGPHIRLTTVNGNVELRKR